MILGGKSGQCGKERKETTTFQDILGLKGKKIQ